MRRGLLGALLLALCGTPAAAAADAGIVIGRSIHGLSLGAGEARVRAVLGPADGPRVFGDDPSDYGLGFAGSRYHAVFATKTRRVLLLSTTSEAQRTASGVGPGVSARFARARLRGERCSVVFDADRQLDLTACVVRRHGVDTAFALFDHEVVEVTLSR